MHAALAIAPVTIGNPAPQGGASASVGGDDTFGQMLRSAYEADEAVTSPTMPDDAANPEHAAAQRSPEQPVTLPALRTNSDQGTKPAHLRRTVNLSDAGNDDVAGPAAATAPGAGEAVTGAGALPTAPLPVLPEAIPESPVAGPWDAAGSGAHGTSADASLAEATDLSGSGNSGESSGAVSAEDEVTTASKVTPHLPTGPTSAGSAATADSTPLRYVGPATAVEAHAASLSQEARPTAPVVAEPAVGDFGSTVKEFLVHRLRRRRDPPSAPFQLQRQPRRHLPSWQPLRRLQRWPPPQHLQGHSTRFRPRPLRQQSFTGRPSGS